MYNNGDSLEYEVIGETGSNGQEEDGPEDEAEEAVRLFAVLPIVSELAFPAIILKSDVPIDGITTHNIRGRSEDGPVILAVAVSDDLVRPIFYGQVV